MAGCRCCCCRVLISKPVEPAAAALRLGLATAASCCLRSCARCAWAAANCWSRCRCRCISLWSGTCLGRPCCHKHSLSAHMLASLAIRQVHTVDRVEGQQARLQLPQVCPGLLTAASCTSMNIMLRRSCPPAANIARQGSGCRASDAGQAYNEQRLQLGGEGAHLQVQPRGLADQLAGSSEAGAEQQVHPHEVDAL